MCSPGVPEPHHSHSPYLPGYWRLEPQSEERLWARICSTYYYASGLSAQSLGALPTGLPCMHRAGGSQGQGMEEECSLKIPWAPSKSQSHAVRRGPGDYLYPMNHEKWPVCHFWAEATGGVPMVEPPLAWVSKWQCQKQRPHVTHDRKRVWASQKEISLSVEPLRSGG